MTPTGGHKGRPYGVHIRSRGASAPEFCIQAYASRSQILPQKEGGRAPKDAPPGTAPCDAARAILPPLARARDNGKEARSPFGAPPRHSEALLGSARASVSWNHRIQT